MDVHQKGCLVDERQFFEGLSTKRAVWWMMGDFWTAPQKLDTKEINMKDSKYPIKVMAVRLLNEGRSASSICKELKVSQNSLRLWYQLYIRGGELNLLPSRRRTYDEKCVIVDDIVKNNLPLMSASVKYGLRSDILKRWVNAYKSHGYDGLQRKMHIVCQKRSAYIQKMN